jgi:histone H3/H4
MAAIIKRKRIFRHIFKPKHRPVYKSHPNRQPPPPTPSGLSRRAQDRHRRRHAQEANLRRYRPGSIIPHSITFNLLAKALREIKYYQSEAMADALLLPYAAFIKVIKEITDECSPPGLRWERDAVVALQMMIEHVLVMVFEMTYLLAKLR